MPDPTLRDADSPRRTPPLPKLSDHDLIRLCRLFGEGAELGLDDYDSLHLAVCQLVVELEGRKPPKTWLDACKLEPALESLLYLARLRPRGQAWADSAFFFSQLRALVGNDARHPQLREPEITRVVLDTVTQALEV
ncbi:MAG: hypothetical protein U0836_20640 [Pirellulales bacterium]